MKKPLPNNKVSIALYSELLTDIKTWIRQAQNRVVMSANAERHRKGTRVETPDATEEKSQFGHFS